MGRRAPGQEAATGRGYTGTALLLRRATPQGRPRSGSSRRRPPRARHAGGVAFGNTACRPAGQHQGGRSGRALAGRGAGVAVCAAGRSAAGGSSSTAARLIAARRHRSPGSSGRSRRPPGPSALAARTRRRGSQLRAQAHLSAPRGPAFAPQVGTCCGADRRLSRQAHLPCTARARTRALTPYARSTRPDLALAGASGGGRCDGHARSTLGPRESVCVCV